MFKNTRESEQTSNQINQSTTSRILSRRRFLVGATVTPLLISSGCFQGNQSMDSTQETPGTTETGSSSSRTTDSMTSNGAIATESNSETVAVTQTEDDSTLTSTKTPYPLLPVPEKGNEGPLVAVATDVALPACREFWIEEEPKLTDYYENGKMRLSYLNFPKPVNQWSTKVAFANFEIINQVGIDGFWQFISMLLDSSDDYSYDKIRSVAEDVGANGDAVVTSAKENKRRETLQSDIEFAHRNGVQEPIAAFLTINDIVIDEEVTAERIKAAVDNIQE